MSTFTTGGLAGFQQDGQLYCEQGSDLQAAINREQANVYRTEYNATYVNASTYTIDYNDTNIYVYLAIQYTSTGACTVTLPQASGVGTARRYIIQDVGGSAATNNITITPNGTDKINGVNASITIAENYGSVCLVEAAMSATAQWFTAYHGISLSNYAEGTFTPTVTLVGRAGNTVPVYSTNTGRYTRIGRQVFVDVYLTGDGGAEGAGTGQINIALPISASASHPTSLFPCGYALNNIAEDEVFGQIAGSGAVITLSYFNSIGSTLTLQGADQNSTTRSIRLKFSYEV